MFCPSSRRRGIGNSQNLLYFCSKIKYIDTINKLKLCGNTNKEMSLLNRYFMIKWFVNILNPIVLSARYVNYLLADGGQPVEAITGRFEANDAFSGATETGVTHTYWGAPGWGRGVVARAAGGGGASRGGECRARARRGHDQRHVGGPAFLHAAAAPTLSPEPAVLGRLQVLTFQHGSLEGRRRLQQGNGRVLHRCALISTPFSDFDTYSHVRLT